MRRLSNRCVCEVQGRVDVSVQYAKWGVDALYSPKDDPRLVCALTAFNPFRNPEHIKDKVKSDAFVERMLDEYGFVIRNSNFRCRVRRPNTTACVSRPISGAT